VDFGSPQYLAGIEAVVDQVPNSATNHDVTLDGTAWFSWTGDTYDGQVLGHASSPAVMAQKVRITTTSSWSWVAWYEIRPLLVSC